MASLPEQDKSAGKGKQKKKSIHVDFTPMVDMNMLLITFFMLCTSLSKPQTMELVMPSKDKAIEGQETKFEADRAITLLLDGKDKIYYYLGEPNYQDYSTLIETDYTADGLRALLLKRNKKVVEEMKELKERKLSTEMPDSIFSKQANEIKKDKSSPLVIIKATDLANYKNLVEVLDEMNICNIGMYAIVNITEADEFLLKNLRLKGELTANIETGKN
jgi:biopolymer transport protein ExbD